MKIQIECDYDQLVVMRDALDTYGRLGMGQLENSMFPIMIESMLWKDKDNTLSKWDPGIKFHLEALKKIIFNLEPNASYGITNPNTPDAAKLSYEMCKKLENFMYEEQNKDIPENEREYNVMKNEPLSLTGKGFVKVNEVKQ